MNNLPRDEELKNRWDDPSDPLGPGIKKLAETILTEKSLRLTEADALQAYPTLVHEGLVVKDGDVLAGKDYGVKSHRFLLYGLVRCFPADGDNGIPNTIGDTAHFVEHFAAHFKTDSAQWGIKTLLADLAYFLLSRIGELDNNKIYTDVIEVKWTSERHTFQALLAAYIRLLTEEPPTSFGHLWEVATHLAHEIHKIENNGNYWSGLTQLVGNYTQHHTSDVAEMKGRALSSMASPELEKLGIAIMAALHFTGKVQLKELLEYLADPPTREFGIRLLTMANFSTPSERQLGLSALQHLLTDSAEPPQLFSYVAVRILKSVDPSDPYDLETLRLFKEIWMAAIPRTDASLMQNLLTMLGGCEHHLEYQLDLLKELIASVPNPKQFGRGFENFLTLHKSPTALFPFFRTYMSVTKLHKLRGFQTCSVYTRQQGEAEFDHQLILLLIDDDGTMRWTGHEILGILLANINDLLFNFNSKEWAWDQQVRLCISLFDGSIEPKHLLPIITPMIYSEDEVIRQVVGAKLEEYVDEYNGIVVEYLDTNLDHSRQETSMLLEALHAHQDRKTDLWKKKMAVKELHPYLTQGSLMRSYMKEYGRDSQKQFDKSYDQNSILAHLGQQVTLLRGGGWRSEDGKEIHKLTTISASIPLPKRFFVNPDTDEFRYRNSFIRNWKDEFKEWQPTSF